jgi:hypothetical protein
MPTGSNQYRGGAMEVEGLSINLGKNGITHSKIYYNKEEDKTFIGDDPGKGWELIGWLES